MRKRHTYSSLNPVVHPKTPKYPKLTCGFLDDSAIRE